MANKSISFSFTFPIRQF